MQAIEIQANVDKNHEVHFTLPDSWQSDKVKLIVLESIGPEKTPVDLMEIEKTNQCSESLNQEMEEALTYQVTL